MSKKCKHYMLFSVLVLGRDTPYGEHTTVELKDGRLDFEAYVEPIAGLIRTDLSVPGTLVMFATPYCATCGKASGIETANLIVNLPLDPERFTPEAREHLKNNPAETLARGLLADLQEKLVQNSMEGILPDLMMLSITNRRR